MINAKEKRLRRQAGELFTDREEPRRTFWRLYDECAARVAEEDGGVQVLTYYGIGGIGKSTLLKKIITEMDERLNSPRRVLYDLHTHQDSRSVLMGLKNLLQKQYDYAFPLFELGLYNYAQKAGEDMAAPEVQSLVSKNSVLELALNVLEELPVVDVFSKLVKLADKGYSTVTNLIEQHRRDIVEIETSTPAELYDRLPELFAADLTDALEEERKPLVILLDTYEELVNELSTVGDPLSSDEWLRGENGLVRNIPYVLWVIAGREKLRWEQFDPDWKGSLEQHLLGGLSEQDAVRFLTQSGIKDETLCRELYTLTRGTPVYLDLCVEQYLMLVGRAQTPVREDFGQSVQKLIERYVRYMDDNEKSMVYLLSCLETWDDALLRAVAAEVLPSFQTLTYERIKAHSFVSMTNEGDYMIHQTMGSVLAPECPPELRSATFDAAERYCCAKLAELNVFSAEYPHYLQRLAQLALAVGDDEALVALFDSSIGPGLTALRSNGLLEPARQALLPLLRALGEDEVSERAARFTREYGRLLEAQGKYAEEEVQVRRACELYSALRGAESVGVAEAYTGLSGALIGLGKYDDALAALQYAISLFTKNAALETKNGLLALQKTADQLTRLGRYDEALDLARSAYKLTCGAMGEDSREAGEALRAVATALFYLGRYDETLQLYQRIYELDRRLLGEDHLSTIAAMQNVSIALSSLRRYREALELSRQVYEKRRELLGEYHPKTLASLNNYAIDLSHVNELDAALAARQTVYEKRLDLFGEKHPETVLAMHNLANSLCDVKRFAEARELGERAYELRCELFGPDHPGALSTLNNLAGTYADLGLFDRAVEAILHAVERRWEKLGADHPDTLSSIERLGNICQRAETPARALPWLERAVDVLRPQAQKPGSRYESLTFRLVMTYMDLGREEEATALARERLAEAEKSGRNDRIGRCSYTLALVLWHYDELEQAYELAQRAYEHWRLEGPDLPATKEAADLVRDIAENLGLPGGEEEP